MHVVSALSGSVGQPSLGASLVFIQVLRATEGEVEAAPRPGAQWCQERREQVMAWVLAAAPRGLGPWALERVARVLPTAGAVVVVLEAET